MALHDAETLAITDVESAASVPVVRCIAAIVHIPSVVAVGQLRKIGKRIGRLALSQSRSAHDENRSHTTIVVAIVACCHISIAGIGTIAIIDDTHKVCPRSAKATDPSEVVAYARGSRTVIIRDGAICDVLLRSLAYGLVGKPSSLHTLGRPYLEPESVLDSVD